MTQNGHKWNLNTTLENRYVASVAYRTDSATVSKEMAKAFLLEEVEEFEGEESEGEWDDDSISADIDDRLDEEEQRIEGLRRLIDLQEESKKKLRSIWVTDRTRHKRGLFEKRFNHKYEYAVRKHKKDLLKPN